MSTKEPVIWHNDFEVYRDYLDEGFVWLELRRTEFEATPTEVRLKIPAAVWEVLRRAAGVDFDMLNVTEEQIAEYVHAAVDERLRDEERATGDPRFAALFGALVFGPVEDARDKQIVRGVEHYTAQREKQRGIAAQIAELKGQTRFVAPSALAPIYARQTLGDGGRREAPNCMTSRYVCSAHRNPSCDG